MNTWLTIYFIGAGVMLLVGVIGMYLMRGQGSLGDRLGLGLSFLACAVLWPGVVPIALFILALGLGKEDT